MSVVAFVVWSPFTERDYRRFGIDEICKKFEVYVFDCSEWLSPLISVEKRLSISEFSGYRGISSYSEFNSVIDQLSVNKGWFVVDLLGENKESYQIRKLLRKRYCSMIRVDLGRLPSTRPSLFDRLCYLWQRRDRVAATIASRLRRLSLGNAEIVIAGGRVAERSHEASSRVIKAHSMDYDIYLALKKSDCTIPVADQKTEYILYLDEDLVFHQDFAHLGLPYLTTAERFFPNISRFFSKIEKQYGIPVIIAAHPRSCYKEEDDYFNGRKIVKGKTPELVKGASLVLAHASTSISFAVLFERPILLLRSKDIDRNRRMKLSIQAFADKLSLFSVNIDEIDMDFILDEKVFQLNQHKYMEYSYDYLKSPDSPDIPVWDLVVSELVKQV